MSSAERVPYEMHADTVTLHEWDGYTHPEEAVQRGELAQIGDPIPVTGPGTVMFPPHTGPFAYVCVIAWLDGAPIYWHSLQVLNGDVPSITLPIKGTLI